MSDSEPEDNDSINSDGNLSETSDTEPNNPTFSIKNAVKEPNIDDDESSLFDDEIEEIDLEDPSSILGASSINKSINTLIDNKKLGMENFNTEIENMNDEEAGVNENDGEYEDEEDEDEDEDEEDEYDEDYNQKFARDIKENYIQLYHPETSTHNLDEVIALSNVKRNKNNIIIDDLHKTISTMTKFEKTKILGLRSSQLSEGAKPLIPISEEIISSYEIASMELSQKKIPFIIKRPIPNGGSEYWKISDLEMIC